MQSNNTEVVQSLSEFLEVLFKRTSKYRNDKIWFRGENSDTYDLVPNIYRRNGEKIAYCQDIIDTSIFNTLERNIDTSFYRRAFSYFSKKGIENSKWNRYYLKQHYGIKTRLLDWSENAFFALFFALHNNYRENENARFWILYPFNLNNYSIQKLLIEDKPFKKILSFNNFNKGQALRNEKGEVSIEGIGRKYYNLICENGEQLFPVAIYPPHLDARMAAQKSCFTVFGNMTNGLNNNASPEVFLDYIDISSKNKNSILKELNIIGISSYSVFPDLDGLGKAINEDSAYDIETSQNNSDLNAFFGQKL